MAAHGHPSSSVPLAHFGDRRLGPYEVLQASHRLEGERQAKDFLLLRPATGEAAAALPPTPSAAELAAAAGAATATLRRPVSKHACAPAMAESDKSEEEEEGAPPEAAASARQAAASFRHQGPSAAAAAASAPPLPTAPTASAHGLPPALADKLAALPPPGPGDTTPKERRTLLRGALPAAALPTPAQLPMPSSWVARTGREKSEFKAACTAVVLLRVRPLACLPATLLSPGLQS